MEEKYKKFLEFDWTASSEWQTYYTNLYPVPPGNKVLHFKKKFYQLKIDSEFDRNYEPPITDSNNSSSGSGYNTTNVNPQNNENYYPKPERGTLFDKITASGEVFLWVLFLFSLVTHAHTLKIALAALIFRVYRRIGRPRWNTQYCYDLFLDEHFQLVLYTGILFLDNFALYTMMPLIVCAVLNIGDFLKNYFVVVNFAVRFGNYIYNNRVEIAKTRANMIVAIGFIMIPCAIVGINHYIAVLFFWQYMRLVYIINNDLKLAFSNLNYYVNKFKELTPSPISYIITKVQELCEYLVRTEARPGEMAGGQNCTIF